MASKNDNDVSAAGGEQVRDEDETTINVSQEKLKVPNELDALAETWRDSKAAKDINHEEELELLLDWRDEKIEVTEQVVTAAAKNWESGEALLKLLFDRRGEEVQITKKVVQAAAGNLKSGEAILKLLLDMRGKEVPITEEVIKMAVEKGTCGERFLMRLWYSHPDLLKRTLENWDIQFEKFTETLYRFSLGRGWVYIGGNREPIWQKRYTSPRG